MYVKMLNENGQEDETFAENTNYFRSFFLFDAKFVKRMNANGKFLDWCLCVYRKCECDRSTFITDNRDSIRFHLHWIRELEPYQTADADTKLWKFHFALDYFQSDLFLHLNISSIFFCRALLQIVVHFFSSSTSTLFLFANFLLLLLYMCVGVYDSFCENIFFFSLSSHQDSWRTIKQTKSPCNVIWRKRRQVIKWFEFCVPLSTEMKSEKVATVMATAGGIGKWRVSAKKKKKYAYTDIEWKMAVK